jgi:hypothetical protein
MTNTAKPSELLLCQECSMPVAADEYHPYAACLMYLGCNNSSVVRANLAALRPPSSEQAGDWPEFPDPDGWHKFEDAAFTEVAPPLAYYHADKLRAYGEACRAAPAKPCDADDEEVEWLARFAETAARESAARGFDCDSECYSTIAAVLRRLSQPQRQGIVGWMHEDELPEWYPYDAMLPFSKVDVFRMFPVYAPTEQPANAAVECLEIPFSLADEILKRDGGKGCRCISHSRTAEMEYESGTCPHQLLSAMLAAARGVAKTCPNFGHACSCAPHTCESNTASWSVAMTAPSDRAIAMAFHERYAEEPASFALDCIVTRAAHIDTQQPQQAEVLCHRLHTGNGKWCWIDGPANPQAQQDSKTFGWKIENAYAGPATPHPGARVPDATDVWRVVIGLADNVEELAFRMSAPNEWTPQFVTLSTAARSLAHNRIAASLGQQPAQGDVTDEQVRLALVAWWTVPINLRLSNIEEAMRQALNAALAAQPGGADRG